MGPLQRYLVTQSQPGRGNEGDALDWCALHRRTGGAGHHCAVQWVVVVVQRDQSLHQGELLSGLRCQCCCCCCSTSALRCILTCCNALDWWFSAKQAAEHWRGRGCSESELQLQVWVKLMHSLRPAPAPAQNQNFSFFDSVWKSALVI